MQRFARLEESEEEEEKGDSWILETSAYHAPVFSMKDGQNSIFNLIATQDECFITFTSKKSAVITINGERFDFTSAPVKGTQDVFKITDEVSENKSATFIGKILGNIKSDKKNNFKKLTSPLAAKSVNRNVPDRMSSNPRTTITEIEIDNLTDNRIEQPPQSKKRPSKASGNIAIRTESSFVANSVDQEERPRKKPKMGLLEKDIWLVVHNLPSSVTAKNIISFMDGITITSIYGALIDGDDVSKWNFKSTSTCVDVYLACESRSCADLAILRSGEKFAIKNKDNSKLVRDITINEISMSEATWVKALGFEMSGNIPLFDIIEKTAFHFPLKYICCRIPELASKSAIDIPSSTEILPSSISCCRDILTANQNQNNSSKGEKSDSAIRISSATLFEYPYSFDRLGTMGFILESNDPLFSIESISTISSSVQLLSNIPLVIVELRELLSILVLNSHFDNCVSSNARVEDILDRYSRMICLFEKLNALHSTSVDL